MSMETHTLSQETTEAPNADTKVCSQCGERKPLSDFLRRTGKRSGKTSRRGACKACRKLRKRENEETPDERSDVRESLPPKRSKRRRKAAEPPQALSAPPAAPPVDEAAAEAPKRLTRRPLPALPPKPEGLDASVLTPTRQGILRMRGKTDKGRRWHQETDLETALTLVREHAAVVVNRHTIRRIYNNKSFRRFILTRDRNICHFCGEYGDTIDHLLPRAKGGHTTPANCVCACNLCNQSKAALSLDEFLDGVDE